MLDRTTKLGCLAFLSGAVLALAGCAGDDGLELPKLGELNPFKEKQTPLPGRRIALSQDAARIPTDMVVADTPVILPQVTANDAWTQPGGVPNNAPGNLAIGGELKKAWTAEAGTGSSNKGRVVASPVVSDGRVYTLDADGLVTAISVSSGAPLWRAALTVDGKAPPSMLGGLIGGGSTSKGVGFGGGLAVDGGRLYAASGYGIVAALDAATGNRIWEKSVGAPIRTSPTATGDRMYIVSTLGNLHCFNGADGTEMWSVHSLAQSASLLNNASPAVDGDTVVAPFASGDVIAIHSTDGKTVWTENLTRTKMTSQLNSLTDAARPAIADGVVYAIGNSGKMIAANVRTGERLWSAAIAGTQTPWVAGDTVYVADTGGQVFALARKDGRSQWITQMPSAKVWSGPIMAGGYLWLVSDKGALAALDATTGKVASSISLGVPVFIAPVVAGGKMFVMTDQAKLIALN